MSRIYEGKIGFGQLLLCLIAAATICIPFAIYPQIEFAFNHLLPIGENIVSTSQTTYLTSILESLSILSAIPESLFNIFKYALYAFYGIIAFDILFTLIMMVLRNEIVRQILRALSFFFGFILIIVTIISFLTIAGFFTTYNAGGFGDAALLDCIKNNGLFFFLGLAIFSFICMIKQFSSFFGMSY